MKKKAERVTATIALCGNPNVGKSTLFNLLTGMKQHTGNWGGKTVGTAEGTYTNSEAVYRIIDLPGTYSLYAHSREEEIARDFISGNEADVAIAVCDATCLERSLTLAIQLARTARRTVICVNLVDEAEKHGLTIDIDALERASGLPCAAISARSGTGIDRLFEKVRAALDTPIKAREVGCACPNADFCIAKRLCGICVRGRVQRKTDMKLDRLLTGRFTALPMMLLLLATVLYITLEGANIPSEWLNSALLSLEAPLNGALRSLGLDSVADALSFGAYRVLAWVVAVMLPPMAIFFPLFTFLEELGVLPRIAFNMDNYFKRSGSCGKQALTMLMGLGCNAAAVVGCRIIDSPRERLIAILTNSFIPCNGRFPALIAVISMFFAFSGAAGGIMGAVLLSTVIMLCIAVTLLFSRILSRTLLKGEPSLFTLELPPYRMPRIGRLLVRSVADRTVFVLGRAAAVAAPAGLLLYILSNVYVDSCTLLSLCTHALEPVGRAIGLDGCILVAFILGFPANEIVLPIAVMAYTANSSLHELPALSDMHALLVSNGWSIKTAVCFIIFSALHWPCSTTLLTIKKETGSFEHTLAAFLLPTVAGAVLCAVINAGFTVMGLD